METDLSKLIFGLTFAFLSPVVCYGTGMAWNKAVGAAPKVNKIWTSFCLLLPIVLLGMLVQVGWDTLRRLWATTPYVLALLAIVFGIAAPAGLIVVITRLWRAMPSDTDRM